MVAGKIILEAVIHDPPTDIVGGDPCLVGQLLPAEPCLLQTVLALRHGHRQSVDLQQLLQHIVVVQDGQFRDLLDPVRPQAADVA